MSLNWALAPWIMQIDKIVQDWQQEAILGELELPRYRMRFFTWGEGPALFFVHGLGTSPRSFLSLMSLLKDRFRCIGYYLPQGLGDKAKLRGYQHRFLSYDWEMLADHLSIKEASILGHSFGSTVAIDCLHRFPDRLNRGVLLSAFAEHSLTWREWFVAHAARWMGGKRLVSQLRSEKRIQEAQDKRPWAKSNPELWKFYLDDIGNVPVKSMGYWGLQLNQVDLQPIIAEIKQPVLLIQGSADRLISKESREYLLQNLKQSQSIIIPDAGHIPIYSHPEKVADSILAFFEPMKEIHQRSFGPAGTEIAASPV